MKVFSSHDTALLYWRSHFPLDGELGTPAKVSHAETCAHLKNDVLNSIPETFRPDNEPIDILVFDPRDRSWSKQVNCHVWGTPLPPNSFYRVLDMYVSSPEFVFLQMASSLTTVQLIALGCELCGTYAIVPRAERSPETLDAPPRRSAPLTNIDKIGDFLNAAKGSHNIVKARRALRYVIEGSRSPMETMVALQLCLPALLGGYGLPRPVLNPVIPLDDEAQLIAKRSWCEGDICWQDPKLDIEYNGSVHGSAEKMRDDASRALGIESMGWKVLTITGPQVFDIDQFEVVAREAAKHLKYRLQSRTLGHVPARLALHEELETWMSADGKS